MSATLATALEAFARQLLLGLGPLFVLGAVLYACQRWTQRLLAEALGWRAVVYWTGWLGTPVHELSHYVVGTLCGLKIVEVKLFDPDDRTGVLGYVRYVKPRLEARELHKVIGTFLMGIAPLFGGAAVLGLAWVLLINPAAGGPYTRQAHALTALVDAGAPAEVARGFFALIGSTYHQVFSEGARRWQTWVFLYVALAVGAHLAPSKADLEGGAVGFLVLCGVGLAANVVATVAGADTVSFSARVAELTAPLTTLLLLALVLNLGNLGLAGATAILKKQRG